MYIDGKFVDASSRQDLRRLRSRHRRRHRHLPCRRRAGRRPGGRGGQEAPSTADGRTPAPRNAAGCCSGSPSGSGPGGTSWPGSRRATPASRSSSPSTTWTTRATCFEYYGGLATKINGEVIPVPANAMVLALQGAGGRRRPDHPLELPAADGGLEARARPRGGLHRGHQARRADAALAAGAGQGFRGGGASARRRQRRHRDSAPMPAAPLVAHPDVRKIAFTGSRPRSAS